MRAAQLLDSGDLQVNGVHKANLIARLFIKHADITLPEQRLWMAVLCNTVGDLLVGSRSNQYQVLHVKRAKREAEQFFCERRHVTLCDWVGLDPDWVLEVLRDHAGLEL